MKCLKCGAEQPEDARFCNKCGNKLLPSLYPDTGFEGSRTPHTLAPERKQVTVLFSDITGYTSITERLDPEKVKQITGNIFAGVREIVARYDGFIERVMGDGVVAFFGVPQNHEDDPVRAVHTAMEIHDLVKGLGPRYESWVGSPLSMHTGINTGLVVTADVDIERGTHGIAGDAVNVAARLSGLAAPGEILVGEETLRRTRGRFNFHDLGLKRVKGKADPIPVFKIVSCKPLSHATGPDRQISSKMVGRDAELARLELLVMKAVNGDGSVVNVMGEAGIGKSRLIAELRKKHMMEGVTLLEGRAVSIGKNLSFHPIIDLMKQWAGVAEGDSQSMGFGKLERAVRAVHPDEADEILAFLGTLMGMKLKGSYAERIQGIEGEALEKLIFKNVRDLLVKGSELRPTVIVLEDLHWADESSLGLLESLYRLVENNRLLFINAFRPGYRQGETKSVVERIGEVLRDRYVEIALQPLDGEMSGVLIGNMLDVKGLPYSVRKQIGERSGGNPFFIEEVVRSLVDQGAIVRRNGSFDVTEKIDSVVVPYTINDVLMARIDTLEEKTRELVKCASVIGRSFFDRLLKDVAASVEDIDPKLSCLKDLQLIRDRIRMGELEHLFKHALTQEVAYESTLLQQRKELHRRVAESIERLFQERLHEFYGMLAYHYSKAEDRDKAEEWMTKAGDEALRASASSEALNYYKEALELYLEKYGDAANQEKLVEFEKNIALSYFNKGQFENALIYFDKIFYRWGRQPHRNRFTAFLKAFLDISLLFIRPYLPALRGRKIPDQHVNEFFDLAFKKNIVLVHINPEREFVEFIREGRQSYRYDLFKLDISGVFHTGISGFFAFAGFPKMGVRYLNQTRRFIKTTSIIDNICLAMMTTACYYASGRWNEITAFDDSLMTRSLSSGLFWYVFGYIYWTCSMKIAQGMFSESEELISKQRLIYIQYNYEISEAAYYILIIQYYIAICKYSDAHDAANTLIRFSKERGLEFELPGYGFKSIIETILGDFQAAKNSLEYFSDLLSKRGLCPPLYYDAGYFAQFLLDIALLENAINSADKAMISKHRRDVFKSGKRSLKVSRVFPQHRTEIYRFIAKYYWLIERPKKAFRWYSRSMEEGQRLGARPELARTYMEIGKRLIEPGSKYRVLNGVSAGEYLKKAGDMFREMDLQWDLEELEKIRGSQ